MTKGEGRVAEEGERMRGRHGGEGESDGRHEGEGERKKRHRGEGE